LVKNMQGISLYVGVMFADLRAMFLRCEIVVRIRLGGLKSWIFKARKPWIA
jgi:hypothetical protein